MLVLLGVWVLITIVLWGIGDASILLYSKLRKQNEKYTFLDTFILGLSLSFIPLGLCSLWIPIDIKLTFIFTALALLYIFFFRLTFIKYKLIEWRKQLISCSPTAKISFILFLLAVIVYNLINASAFDAVNYHYQQTAWNEQFAVVPGLANLESRFGFNSNHLLLSALFAFTEQLGEPLYAIQSLLSFFFGCWIFRECVTSKLAYNRLFLLALFATFYIFQNEHITNSSTDIIPSLIILYLASKLIFYPDSLKTSTLLYAIIPIALVTIKISVVPFYIISLVIYLLLIRNRDYRSIAILITLSLCILIPWFIRNAIISGYMIYPVHWIDLFSFEWKVPKFVAELEHGYIRDFAWARFFENVTFEPLRKWLNGQHHIFFILIAQTSIAGIFSWIVFASPFIVFLKNFISKNKLHTVHLLLYVVLALIILVSFSAPDFRFVSGVYYAIIFFLFTLFFSSKKKQGKYYFLLLLSICMLLGATKNFHNFEVQRKLFASKREVVSVLVQPYGPKALSGITIANFETYQLGDLTIYLSNLGVGGITYDILPATFMTDSREAFNRSKKFLPLEAIEPRSNKLSDGFKPIKDVNSGWWVRDNNWWNGY